MVLIEDAEQRERALASARRLMRESGFISADEVRAAVLRITLEARERAECLQAH